MGKEVSQKGFFIAVVLVLGAIVFAASLQPETTGQIVTRNSFEPVNEEASSFWSRVFGKERTTSSTLKTTGMIAENCNSCPKTKLYDLGYDKTATCRLINDCPTHAVLYNTCQRYSCRYFCTSPGGGGVFYEGEAGFWEWDYCTANRNRPVFSSS